MVLLSEQYYEQETLRQMRGQSTHLKLRSNPFPVIVSSLNFKLQLAFEAQLLTRKELDHHMVNKYNVPTIYIYTVYKVHKSLTRPPGRPIISAIKGPLEQMGKYVDALVKGMVRDLPSFVQDTRDVLSRIAEVEVSDGALLVGIDVESLYNSIPHQYQLAVVAHFLQVK